MFISGKHVYRISDYLYFALYLFHGTKHGIIIMSFTVQNQEFFLGSGNFPFTVTKLVPNFYPKMPLDNMEPVYI